MRARTDALMPLKAVIGLSVVLTLGLLLIVGLSGGVAAAPAPTPLSDVDIYAHAVPTPPVMGGTTYTRFERIGVEQGLSQNLTTSIVQDRRGFLWFATFNGLDRYDGYGIKSYRHDPADPHSLGDNAIWVVYQDGNGLLWIGTNSGGLDSFDPETGQFTHYTHNPEDPHSLSSNSVLSIYEDGMGTLWVGTNGGGLNRFDPETGGFTRYTHDPEDPYSLSNDVVETICEDDAGMLWVGTSGGGLNRFNPETGGFTHYTHDPADPHSLGDNFIWAIIYDNHEELLWIGTNSGGLNRFDPETGRVIRYTHDPEDPHSLSNDMVQAICPDAAGSLWVGTNGGGLNRFDPETGRVIRYTHDPEDPHSLSNDSIMAVYQDRAGLIWVGTWGGEINKYDPKTEQFVHYRHRPGDPNSLNHNGVYAIHEDRAGVVWIGTNGGGLNRLDPETGGFTHYTNDPSDPHSLSSDGILSLAEDEEGKLWMGTWGGGLNRFDPETGHFTRYLNDPADPHSLSSNTVLVLHVDSQGVLWVGTWGGGLDRFDPASGEFIHYTHNPEDPHSMSDNTVWALLEDRAGALWVGTNSGGLNRLDPETGHFTCYINNPEDPSSLSGNTITSIYEDGGGVLWVGTNGGGLNRLDPATGGFTRYGEEEGLPGSIVYAILEDGRGYLWLSTSNGLSRFDPASESFKNYDVSDGLQDNDFNINSGYGDEEGRMFFGGLNGFNVFYPEGIRDNPYLPPLTLTDFRIFNKPVEIGGDSPLQKPIEETDGITLSYRDYIVSFEFAALSYTAPEKNRYAYMLEGFDKEWVYVDADRRFAGYSNLPAGEYTFRVRGSNDDGIWNDEGISVRITVTPPLWETWWFRGLAALLLVAVVAGAFQLRMRALQARSRQLELRVQERTEELSAANKELERLYHATRQVNRLRVLNELDMALAGTLDTDTVLEVALRQVAESLGASTGRLLVLSSREDASCERVFDLQEGRVEAGECDAGDERRLQSLIPGLDVGFEPVLLSDGDANGDTLAAPVLVEGEPVAVFLLGLPVGRDLTDDDFALVQAAVNRVGQSVQSARLYEAEREQRRLVEQSQAQLIHSEKMAAMGRLTASLAHEINNPLQVLRSGFRLLLNRQVNEEKRLQYLQAANRQTERLIGIVERMLDFYRPSSEQMKKTDVNAVLEETLLLCGKKLEHGGVQVCRELAPDLPPVEAVADQLEQVFLNLMLNALEAMPDGGQLTVQTRADLARGEVRIAFIDTGVGIREEEIDRLTEPFYTTRPEGSGLGLPISYGIVERHGGRIEIESQVGVGSTFSVVLARSEQDG